MTAPAASKIKHKTSVVTRPHGTLAWNCTCGAAGLDTCFPLLSPAKSRREIAAEGQCHVVTMRDAAQREAAGVNA